MNSTNAIELHHVNIPVASLDASRLWYCQVLGYEIERDFVEDGVVVGTALRPPNTGVRIALRSIPDGFHVPGYPCLLAFSVPALDDLIVLREHLDYLGIDHSPMRDATTGSVLELVDPNGWVVRVYTVAER